MTYPLLWIFMILKLFSVSVIAAHWQCAILRDFLRYRSVAVGGLTATAYVAGWTSKRNRQHRTWLILCPSRQEMLSLQRIIKLMLEEVNKF